MSLKPILLIGGYGLIGRATAQSVRAAHPDVPLLIGGRSLDKAKEVASEVGHAEGVAIDLARDDLGLGDREVSAVAIFLKDETLAALRFAQARGVPHISISSGINEIGPEVAAFMSCPYVAPVVLGAEWLVGATTIPTLEFGKEFGRIDDITLGALIDEQENAGPATVSDMHRLTVTMPAALIRRDGAFLWCSGDEAEAKFRAVDGTEMEAAAVATYDTVGLSAATNAPSVRLNLATGISSSRRRGEPMSTEIIIELAGVDQAGQPLRTRHAIIHPQGQMPLTSLGMTMMLERLLGLDGKSAVPAGLYFPHQIIDHATYFARLKQIGGIILTLDVL